MFPVVELDLLLSLLVFRLFVVVVLLFFFFFVSLASSLAFGVPETPSGSSVWCAILRTGDDAAFGFEGRTGGIGFSNRSRSDAVSGSFKISNARRALFATSSFSLVSYRFQSQILISL